MTPQEFIAEAKRRGKSKEETLIKYNQLMSSGAFSSNQQDPLQSTKEDNAKWDNYDVTQDMSGTDKFLAGAGKAFTDVFRGVGQLVGAYDEKDIDEIKQRDANLMNTGAGIAGNITGNIAAFAPAAFVPGANGAVGASVIGAGMGALQPVGTDDSRLLNTGLGAAGGYVGNKVGGKIADSLGKRIASKQTQKAANATKDAFLNEAKQQGYKVPASYQRAGVTARMAEGLSGKYKTNQLAGIKNQAITDKLARQAIGLPDDVPLTREVMQSVRKEAFDGGYQPVRNIGKVSTDGKYIQAIDDAMAQYKGASRSFPGAVADDVGKALEPLKVKEFDASDAVDMIQYLRDSASKAYSGGDKGLGKALRKASDSLEDQLERALESTGKQGRDVLKNFRDSRQLMAKTHTVEEAIVDGNVDALKIAGRWKKGKPLSGELKTIGRFGEAYRDVAGVPKSGNANPFTVLDFGFGGMGGLAVDPTLAALPLARVGARQALLSSPVQNAIGPNYSAPATQLAKYMLANKPARGAMSLGLPAGLIGLNQ